MKKISTLLLLICMTLISCKKERVDASSTQAFQQSINDMASNLSTIKQIKFNEALYILKAFGVEGDTDQQKLTALAKLLQNKNVQEINKLADDVAAKNEIVWSSTGTPSLGEMNIFGDDKPKAIDNNNINANKLDLLVSVSDRDSITGVKAMKVIPKFLDANGKPVVFKDAALEAKMDIISGGNKIFSSKNLITNNNFKGFNLKFSSLDQSLVTNEIVDILVSVKTTNKNFKVVKNGVLVNKKALRVPQKKIEPSASTIPIIEGTSTTDEKENIVPEDGDKVLETEKIENTAKDKTEKEPKKEEKKTDEPKKTEKPEQSISTFLNQIKQKNLKAAFNQSQNPSWGSYEKFSNINSGFGTVKNLIIKNISTKSSDDKSAVVVATYDVTDQNDKKSALNVTFGLKNQNGQWKITSYKIN